MNTNVIHIGLDVDDTNFHEAALDRETGECLACRCRPTVKSLVKKPEKVRLALGGERPLRLCYEATYVATYKGCCGETAITIALPPTLGPNGPRPATVGSSNPSPAAKGACG